MYPGTWFVRGTAKDYLDLLDAKNGGATGSVVAYGHVAAAARLEPKDNGTTLEAVSATYLKYSKRVIVRDRPVAISDGKPDCIRVVEQNTTFSDDPLDVKNSKETPFKESIDFFCETRAHKIVSVGVLFWEGDKRRSMYRDVGLRMVKSLIFH